MEHGDFPCRMISGKECILSENVSDSAIKIDYFQENDLVLWILRTVAILGSIVGGISVLTFLLDYHSITALASLPIWQLILQIGAFALNLILVAGCVKTMYRSISGRQLLLTYAYGTFIYAVGVLCWMACWAMGFTGVVPSSGWGLLLVVLSGISRNVNWAIYPALIILLLRRPEFRRAFDGQ